MLCCSHVDSFADVNLDYLTSIHELETASSHDMLSFPGKRLPQQFLPPLILALSLTCPQDPHVCIPVECVLADQSPYWAAQAAGPNRSGTSL